MITLCQILLDENMMITRWLKIVAWVLVLMFPEGWPWTWRWTGALPVVASHASS